MSTVPITTPRNDGDAFPDTIAGDFTLSNIVVMPMTTGGYPPPPPPDPNPVPVPVPVISVWVKREDTNVTLPVILAAISTASPTATSGTWTAPKPSGVVTGVMYKITATLTHPDYNAANDNKQHIQA